MAAVGFRVRVWVRRRRRQLVFTALLVGLIGGVVMGLAGGTRRTASAPDRYTAQSGGDPDLSITQLSGDPLTAQIAAIPGVAEARSTAFVTAFFQEADRAFVDFNPFAGDDRLVGARVIEGRFTDPAAPDEFTANRTLAALLAERYGTKVGDRVQVTSFSRDQLQDNRAFSSGEPPAVPVFSATLVGVTETPSDFDDPTPDLVFSRAFVAAHATVGLVQTTIAVRLDPGTDPEAVMNAVHELPNGGDAFNSPYRIVSADARRAVGFQVTALWLVTGAAAIAGVLVIAQLVGRMLSTPEDEGSSLRAVGWRRRDLAIERVVEGGLIAAIATPVAVLVAFAVTGAFPLGVLQTFEPDAGPRMDWTVASIGILVTLAVVVIVAAIASLRRLPRADAGGRVARFAGLVAAIGAGVTLVTGARLATTGPTGGRRSLRSLASGAIGLAALVGAGVVGLSLTHIVDRPARWGINYDQLSGNPFVPAGDDIVTPVIANPDVEDLAGANVGSLNIDGRHTATLAFDSVKGTLVPTTLSGRAPSSPGEIGLGAEVARRLDVGVGDDVRAVGPTGIARTVQVVGIAVTPESAGDGAAMTFDGYAALSPTATRNILLIRFHDGAPSHAGDEIAAANYTPPDSVVTPTSVRALERVTAAPFVLAVVLTALLVLAGAYLLAASSRARRTELAVLRALGSSGRQLRAIVHWQANLVAGFVVLVGLPVGVLAGRKVVDVLTDTLGIVPGAEVPPGLIVALILIVGLTANVLALLPARRAARATMRVLTRDR